MTRVGWTILLVFLLAVAAFALMLRESGPSPSVPGESATPAPTAAAMPAGGGLIVPVAGVTPDKLTDTWGEARGEGMRQHHAIDIIAPRGTPVLAAAAGTVEKIFESRNGGHTVYIRRADPTWQDYYAHLDRYAPDLREGVQVKQGQKIGEVGSTGDASAEAPHLHYEIHHMAQGEGWWQGSEINPYLILHGSGG